jgi:hypothetical protein
MKISNLTVPIIVTGGLVHVKLPPSVSVAVPILVHGRLLVQLQK